MSKYEYLRPYIIYIYMYFVSHLRPMDLNVLGYHIQLYRLYCARGELLFMILQGSWYGLHFSSESYHVA